MITLVLLTAPGCHLCAHGRDVLDELAAERLCTWREVGTGTPEGHALERGAAPFRPVLFDSDGRVVAFGRLSARRLRRDLSRRNDNEPARAAQADVTFE